METACQGKKDGETTKKADKMMLGKVEKRAVKKKSKMGKSESDVNEQSS